MTGTSERSSLYSPTHDHTVAELRKAGSTEPLPEGWAVDELRWQGDNEAWEIAFDPDEVSVLRTGPNAGSESRRLLGQAGYRVVATDKEGACLWVADTDALANTHPSRLDHAKRQRQAPQPAAGLW